jgi:hypothetical protein
LQGVNSNIELTITKTGLAQLEKGNQLDGLLLVDRESPTSRQQYNKIRPIPDNSVSIRQIASGVPGGALEWELSLDPRQSRLGRKSRNNSDAQKEGVIPGDALFLWTKIVQQN